MIAELLCRVTHLPPLFSTDTDWMAANVAVEAPGNAACPVAHVSRLTKSSVYRGFSCQCIVHAKNWIVLVAEVAKTFGDSATTKLSASSATPTLGID